MSNDRPTIRAGHSVLFHTLEGLEKRLAQSVDPIELVLPARADEYPPLLDQTDEVAVQVHQAGAEVMSVHAPPVHMWEESFVHLAARLARMAEAVGAESITLHPSKCVRKGDYGALQDAAVDNIHLAQAGTSVILAMETLAHSRCLFLDEEIMNLGFEMVLDTTHVGWERSYEILASYKERIRTIHLSQRTEQAHHQRIDEEALRFVDELVRVEWRGDIVLEYWPWRWKCYSEDVAKVKARLL